MKLRTNSFKNIIIHHLKIHNANIIRLKPAKREIIKNVDQFFLL